MCCRDSAEGDDEPEAELQKKGLPITPDSQFLAIRVLLYDRDNSDAKSFQPHVFAALLDTITHKARAKKTLADQAEQQFTVRRNQFLNLVKSIDGTVSGGQTLTCRVTRGQVNATVGGIVSRPLAKFTSETEVQAFRPQS